MLLKSSLLLPSAWAPRHRVQSTRASPAVQFHHHCQLVVVHSSSEGGKGWQPLPEGLPDPNWQLNEGKRDIKKRRRGRPAHLRSPDDTPLRDGNRDIMAGVLTERAAKTLLIYLQEMNPIVFQWLWRYMEAHPIPRKGAPWDDISGETFLRTLLAQPVTESKMNWGKDSLFDNTASMGVDPRALAQRIMDIRVQLSKEFIQDLALVKEENQALLQETLMTSLNSEPAKHPIPTIKVLPPLERKLTVHPELLNKDGMLDPEIAKNYPELEAALKKQKEEQQQQGKKQ
ncbi:hypothetical protein DUNSADRAFT_2801 [Dunaliella salina]|uniref:Uncharacterized protein n=1 Tax=Dunaliella salina TaxID=3046 RepID=A0ABQ7GV30_DUNSA|nr:hypothetical protein DUNSADRAFT_2801 [Dunaliella salina]|eukprot:KAF5838472.1 hypothetical protein DUNSADRAFT_2801 [Dunaliella salina]